MRNAELIADWLVRTIHRIYGDREFQLQHQKTANLKAKIKEMDVFLQQRKNLLEQIEETLVKMKKGGSFTTRNDQIKIFIKSVPRS